MLAASDLDSTESPDFTEGRQEPSQNSLMSPLQGLVGVSVSFTGQRKTLRRFAAHRSGAGHRESRDTTAIGHQPSLDATRKTIQKPRTIH